MKELLRILWLITIVSVCFWLNVIFIKLFQRLFICLISIILVLLIPNKEGK